MNTAFITTHRPYGFLMCLPPASTAYLFLKSMIYILILFPHKTWSAHAGISAELSFSVCNTKNGRKQVTLNLTGLKIIIKLTLQLPYIALNNAL